MLGLVTLHGCPHRVRQLLVVLAFGHVNEVNGNDASDVTESEQACNFLDHIQVGDQCIFFLTGRTLLSTTGVDVNDVHGLGLLQNQVRAASQVDLSPKRRFDLAMDGHGVEQILRPADFHHAFVAAATPHQKLLDFVRNARIVDVDGFAIGRHHVTHDDADLVHFTQDPFSWLGTSKVVIEFFPAAHEVFQIAVQVCRAFVFGYGSHNDAKPWRLNALHEAFQPCALFLPFDARGKGDFVAEGHQDQVPPRQADFSRQPRAFGADGFFGDLNEHQLRCRHVVFHLAFSLDVFFPFEFADV